MPVPGTQRQVELCIRGQHGLDSEPQSSHGYIVRCCLKEQQQEEAFALNLLQQYENSCLLSHFLEGGQDCMSLCLLYGEL